MSAKKTSLRSASTTTFTIDFQCYVRLFAQVEIDAMSYEDALEQAEGIFTEDLDWGFSDPDPKESIRFGACAIERPDEDPICLYDIPSIPDVEEGVRDGDLRDHVEEVIAAVQLKRNQKLGLAKDSGAA